MKKTLVYFIFLSTFLTYLFLLSNSGGAPSQTTGAPGEPTCGRSGCHAVVENVGSASIDLMYNDSILVYAPGEIYPLSVAINDAQNTSSNGFQIVALDAENNNAGTWNLIEENTTRIRTGSTFPDRSYVTQTTIGSKESTWKFNWQAPDEAIGAITFYLAINDANANGGRTGDDIYIANLSIDQTASTNIVDQLAQQIEVFPNPTVDYLKVLSTDNLSISQAILYNGAGQVVLTQKNPFNLDLSIFNPGVYFLALTTEKGSVLKKILLH